MIIIILMSKLSWKDIFTGFQNKFLKVNLLLWKKAVLYTTTLTHCKARQVLRDQFNSNQVNVSEIIFVA